MEAESNEQTTNRGGAESQPSAETSQSPSSRLRDLIPEKDPMGRGQGRPAPHLEDAVAAPLRRGGELAENGDAAPLLQHHHFLGKSQNKF